MGFRYETHMHTSEASACSSSTAAEMVRAHYEKGYTGVFVTDHFFNGNSCIPRELPWKQRVDMYCAAYEHALEEGKKLQMDVFFGIEYGVDTADFLVYNLDKQWLYEHEDIDREDPRKAFDLMHEGGAFIVHAHPFRERDYIQYIRLFPRHVDAVEAINGAQSKTPEMNERAELYAKMYDLPITAGSDSHHVHALLGSGIDAPRRIVTPLDYFEMIKNKELKLWDADRLVEIK